MRSVFFGLASNYDSGSIPAVALNRSGTVLEVHKNEAGFALYYHVGQLDKMSVTWGPSHQYDNGNEPRCALNASNVAVEVHKNQVGGTLYYHVGRVSGVVVEWGNAREYDSGITPAVAVNDGGSVVEVHKTQSPFSNSLYYHVGNVSGDKINWGGSHEYDSGSAPVVALNNAGAVVEVHQSQAAATLWYHAGRVNGGQLDLGSSVHFADGTQPSVALNDDGTVIVVWTVGGKLMQRIGQLSGNTITWRGDALEYDSGSAPSVAMASDMAIQVHPSETVRFGLWFSTSLLTDRASWMQNRLATLGNQPLSALVLPASHDAGMYTGGIAIFGKTQELSLYGQLSSGVRWFDLRPKWTGSKFIIAHGIIDGPDVSEVLADVARFAREGHRELVILKLSHFDGIDDSIYTQLTKQVTDSLGSWLVKVLPAGKRLADVTLAEYVASGPAIVVVVDDDYAITRQVPGLWVYRDWESVTPAAGDLRVFDQYANTTDLDKMKADQFSKFQAYDGRCKNDPSVVCDLFLLSWTLTPVTGVWFASQPANRSLGAAMTALTVPNRHGKIVNMLYVDYVEFARVADVALFQHDK